MKIYPKRVPLVWPISLITVCRILGITRSRYRLWEKDGIVPEVGRGPTRGTTGRVFYPHDLLWLLENISALGLESQLGELRLIPGTIVTLNGFEIDL